MCSLKWSHWRCLANEIKSVTLDEWVTLMLNCRLNRYVFTPIPMDRYIGEWLYYYSDAGSSHAKKLYSIKVEFYSKTKQKIAFWATLWGLRGSVCTPSIARWKARGQLIRHNWTFFAISYGWCQRFSKRRGSLWAQISGGRGLRSPTTVGVRIAEWLPFSVVSKYLQCIVWFCHKAHVWRMDKQNYGS